MIGCTVLEIYQFFDFSLFEVNVFQKFKYFENGASNLDHIYGAVGVFVHFE